MHKIDIPEFLVQRYAARRSKPHVFDVIAARRTAHLVVDMQNAFVAPGQPVEIPLAHEIVPNINRLSEALRAAGGSVVYLQNTVDAEAQESWPNYLQAFLGPARGAMFATAFEESSFGHGLWQALEVLSQDLKVQKRRFSAFVDGSSRLHELLTERSIDTVIVTGTSTNVCCESTARDASMMNYKVIFVADATATYTDAEQNWTLGNMMMFADVMTVDEVVSAIAAGS